MQWSNVDNQRLDLSMSAEAKELFGSAARQATVRIIVDITHQSVDLRKTTTPACSSTYVDMIVCLRERIVQRINQIDGACVKIIG
jgi:hypothetical protein